MKQTVVFDFDGVIHSYTSGWQGETCIPDPPTPGIQKAIHSIHEAGYEVVVVSTRCRTLRGRMAIENWLDMYQMTQDVDRVCKEKPPAIVYIDDRAICFDGKPENLLGKIRSFNPWDKKTDTNADRIRAMSDEEMAIMFAMLKADLTRLDRPVRQFSGRDANDNYDWLQQPPEEVYRND